MAADYIAISRTNRSGLGTQLVNLANGVKDICDRAAGLNLIAGHTDATSIETLFTLPAGTGANVASLLVSVDEIFNLNTAEYTAAVRIAKLKELVGRLAGQ